MQLFCIISKVILFCYTYYIVREKRTWWSESLPSCDLATRYGTRIIYHHCSHKHKLKFLLYIVLGETSYSFTQPKKKCNSDGSKLCEIKTCSYCWTRREQSSNIFRGTILVSKIYNCFFYIVDLKLTWINAIEQIPCRTAMRSGFPLNGTYFQTNEASVFFFYVFIKFL